jgi:hypothetical protein
MALPLERESHRFELLGGALRRVDVAIDAPISVRARMRA